MPEGDSLYKLAAKLRPHFLDQTLTRVVTRDRGEALALRNCAVTRVESVGKHLLVSVEGGWIIRVHLGMRGRCFLGEPRPHTSPSVTLVLETRRVQARITRAAIVDIAREKLFRLSHLGPDLLEQQTDIERAVVRFRSPGLASVPVGEALLDQRISAGIGNVYKSEVLFILGIHPEIHSGKLSKEQAEAMFRLASDLLKKNVRRGGRRVTTTGRERAYSRFWVYGRKSKPCMRCGTAINRIAQGTLARTTYFCPTCQPRAKHTSGLTTQEAEPLAAAGSTPTERQADTLPNPQS